MTSITLKDVDNAVCAAFLTAPEKLKGRARAQVFVRPRFAFYHLARTCTERSLPQIGTYLHRDHTTVLHGLCRAVKLQQEDAKFAGQLEQAASILFNSAPYRRRLRIELAPVLPDLQATG